VAVLLLLVTTVWWPSWVVWAHPDCAAGQEPSLSPTFASLRERLGEVMGGLLGCEHVDWESGDAYVETTAGIAVYQRATDRLMFTNGREFWSLNTGGLTHWTGWHGQAGPMDSDPNQATPDEQLTVASIGHYPKAEAATISRSVDAEGRQLILQHGGDSYLVETQGGCTDGQSVEGRRVFVVSSDAFAEPSSRLILRISGRECVIAASRPV
jgi:hypothetical protein